MIAWRHATADVCTSSCSLAPNALLNDEQVKAVKEVTILEKSIHKVMIRNFYNRITHEVDVPFPRAFSRRKYRFTGLFSSKISNFHLSKFVFMQ